MRRSTGKRRRSSRIPPTRRNSSYAPSRPSHRGSANRFNRDRHTAKLIVPRGGAPCGQLRLDSGLLGSLLGKRRTEFHITTKLRESSCVLMPAQICPQPLLPTRAARLTKVEANREARNCFERRPNSADRIPLTTIIESGRDQRNGSKKRDQELRIRKFVARGPST